MTKCDLYLDILPKLASYLNSAGRMNGTEYADFNLELSFTHNEQACDKLLALANIGPFRKIVQYLKYGLSDTADLTIALPLRRRVVGNDENKKRLADICFYSTPRTVITSKAVSVMMNVPDEAIYDSERFRVIEMLWLMYKDDVNNLNHLWEIVSGLHQNEYYIFTNEADDEKKDWNQYAYCYFNYVNKHHFNKPTALGYVKGKEYVPNIAYNTNNKYEQYFDAYDVMSESLFSEDVLQRYLRMYQILEYFGYRRILASFTKGNIRENGFVRNVINKASGRGGNELNEIKSGVSDLIPHLATTSRNAGVFVATDITASMETFIKDKLLLSGYSFNDDQLWLVIYKLRNCIVHNKESELHFTYSNTDVYNDGIGLMKMIIEKMEPQIINIINDPAITGLEFDRQYEAVF